MSKLSKREYIIAGICSIIVIGYLLYLFVFSGSSQGSSDMKDTIALAINKLEKNRSIIQSNTQVQTEYQKLVGILGVAGSEGGEFSALVSKLELLAKEADIHVANVQPQRSLSKEMIKVFPVELTIDGKWAQINRFLYLVQAQQDFFSIDELNLEKYSDVTTSLRGRIVLSRVRVAASN